MELNVNINEKELQTEALRVTILKGAVDHLMASMTPELLRTFMEKVLQQAFDSITGWQMANAAKPYVEQFAKEYMELPDTQERVRLATRAAIDTALGKLPGDIAADLANLARNEFKRAVENKLGR